MKYRVKRHAVTQPRDKPYRYIPLTRNQNAIVDAADFKWLSRWNWNAHWSKCTKSYYAHSGHRSTIAMHMLILACLPTERVDHINHNTLDNRRENLRKCSNAQNSWNRKRRADNSSGFKGVSWAKEQSKWRAYINSHGKRTYLGFFDSKEDAARAYDNEAKKFHGKFALLNFPS